MTARHKLSLCCIFTCDTSAFFIHQTFCRQDGGIAIPPFAQHHIYASLVKGEVLSPEKIRATTGGIAASTHSITTTLCPAPPPSPYKRSADSPSTLIKTHPHSPFSPRVSPQLLLRFPHRQPRRRPTRNRICSSARRSAPLCLASPAFQPF